MNNDPKTMLNECETLMLDMDGTVLDLAYDNYVWKELVPEHYAEAKGLSIDVARNRLYAKYQAIQGDIQWYCLDHWSERLGLDVLELHRGVNHRIDYLPGARDFLHALREHHVRVMLVTNSHPDTLALKDEVTGLAEYFDAIYTSHQFGYAKERQEFWHALQEEEGFRRESTLFVDDNQTVLKSADTYGLSRLVEINHPDTSEPARETSAYTSVTGVADLLSS
ncbi:MAG: GMP/IMP nucleotidase [Gammaproteobacteria bacterium]|nr:GMP/IMP nucleotidase [Gammaproteobacteria bacterium]